MFSAVVSGICLKYLKYGDELFLFRKQNTSSEIRCEIWLVLVKALT